MSGRPHCIFPTKATSSQICCEGLFENPVAGESCFFIAAKIRYIRCTLDVFTALFIAILVETDNPLGILVEGLPPMVVKIL